LKPGAFFGLTFTKGAGKNRKSFQAYIELNEEDADLLVGAFVSAKSRAIVRRTAILDFLPSGINDGWASSGRIVDSFPEGLLKRKLRPWIFRGHNVWILGHT
jgi:hypothetical protein